MRFEKRRLNTGLLSAALALGAAGFAFGDDKGSGNSTPPPPPAGQGDRQRPEGRGEGAMRDPGRMLDRIQELYGKLNLSDDQKTKVKSIIDDAKKNVAAAMKDLEGKEPRERVEKMREVMQPVREKLMDVLDETQREKLREEFRGGEGGRFGSPDAQRPNRPGEQSDRPDGARRGRDPGDMIKRLRDNLPELKLSDDQKQKVDSLLSDTEKKITDLRTEAEKQAQETRAKFREAFESNKQKLDSILTDDQKKKLQELMPAPQRPDGERPGRAGPRNGASVDSAKPKQEK
jgi:hypothetical protein